MREAKARGISLAEAERFEAISGRGIVALVEGRDVALGSLRMAKERSVETKGLEDEAERLQAEAKTILWVSRSRRGRARP